MRSRHISRHEDEMRNHPCGWNGPDRPCVVETTCWECRFQNVVVLTFQDQTTVTTSFKTSLNVIEKDIAVTEEAKALDKTVQMKATVLAIKNFQSVSKCFLCKSAIMPQQSHALSLTIEFTTCESSFLKTKGAFSNQCLLMLSDHNWYKASTSVSISML